MPRKDRLKIVTERCQQMASLLTRLRSSADAEDDARIAKLLEAVSVLCGRFLTFDPITYTAAG
jgi:hypothetical protein